MILVFKCLREQAFAADMLFKRRLCVILVEFEGNNKIGLEHTRELLHHNHGIAAERAGSSGGRRIADYLAAAGLADIGAQPALLVLCPLVPNLSLLFIVGS